LDLLLDDDADRRLSSIRLACSSESERSSATVHEFRLPRLQPTARQATADPQSAALLVAQLPTLVLYVVAQRFVVRGLTAGAVWRMTVEAPTSIAAV
jgi:hypothetical protein